MPTDENDLVCTDCLRLPLRELWTLKHKGRDTLVPPIDDPPVPIGMLFASEQDALAGATHQRELYEIFCEPVRLLLLFSGTPHPKA